MKPAGRRADEGGSRGSFAGFIGPKNLVDAVAISAPWLFDGTHPQAGMVGEGRAGRLSDLAGDALGWWSVLRCADRLPATSTPTSADVTDYFALCLAAHFASVATYVPTDVDAKIRSALWLDQGEMRGAETDVELVRMRELALGLGGWDVSGVSARIVDVAGFGAVSGHDGERLSVLCGALVASVRAGDEAGAAVCEMAIDGELAREAAAFDAVSREVGREAVVVDLASILTHNAGDVMQALGAKGARGLSARPMQRFGELARERLGRYGGAFGRAAAVYRDVAASEGHRHYPLREVKLLRASPELLLPLGPFLDAWGAKLATWPRWSIAERAQVVTGLVEGCRRVPGQQGYFRALAGFDEAFRGGLASRELAAHLSGSTRKSLASAEVRCGVEVPRASFETSQAKRVRRILGGWTTAG